jgi:hypothetical protein
MIRRVGSQLIDVAALIAIKREHLKRLANQKGADGERVVIDENSRLIARPTGKALKALLAALAETGIVIRKSSFDAIYLPEDVPLGKFEGVELKRAVSKMTFVEIKTANQSRVRPDFSGYFFALTEGEIQAAEVLGERHKVVLFNKLTNVSLLTSIPDLLARARSTNWQVSIQL